jgi:hypothetical protein
MLEKGLKRISIFFENINLNRVVMTYDEAEELALTVRWKTSVCNQGEKCWCRMIEPEEQITDDDGNEIFIVHSACVPKTYAEHIVQLHNKSLEK